MDRSTTVLESQPDWITVTVVGQRSVSSVHAHTEALKRAEKVAGNRESPFHVGEYVGTRCGRVRSGTSGGRLLVQLSGDLAALQLDWYKAKAHAFTRLDLAVTVQTATYEPSYSYTAYREAVGYRQTHPRRAVPSLVVNGAGGSTVYLGKRTSDTYFRCYDKQEECRASGDAEGLERYIRSWRFELEAHDDAATAIVYAMPPNPNRSGWITAYIHTYLLNHGIVPRFTPTQRAEHVGGFRRRSDRESRMDWLSRSVAPTVRWLLDSTPRDELLTHLGLGPDEGVTQ